MNYRCCKDEDFCNKIDSNSTVSSISNLPVRLNDESDQSMWPSIVLLSVSFVLILLSLILFLIYVSKRLKKRKLGNVKCDCEFNLHSRLLCKESRKDASNCKIDTNVDAIIDLPITTSSTLDEELEFKKLLSRSEFGCKYLARRQDQDTFVKMLNANLKAEWQNEIDIYKIILIRHENILNFIAKGEFFNSELRSTSYLIVTEYHQLGSLENYLESKPNLSAKQMLKLMLTAASGLNHLHLEISNNQRKPSIVHRNVNSKNFIIKANLTCVLGNFENAFKSTDLDNLKCSPSNCKHKNRLLKIVSNPIVYCPPEYLDKSINIKSIVSLKSADIYSFGLVLSQVLDYYLTSEYRLPFSRRKDLSDLSIQDLGTCKDEVNEIKRMTNLLLEQKFTILDDLADVYTDFKSKSRMKDDLYRNLCLSNYLPLNHTIKSHQTTDLDVHNRPHFDDDHECLTEIDDHSNEKHPHNTQTRSIILELFRIIKESCYLEPFSRLSARKIENDLNLFFTKL